MPFQHYTFPLGTLFSLGGTVLTDDSRSSFEEQWDQRVIEVDLASGKIVKFIKKSAKKWTIQWDLMPMDSSYTIDNKGGRNQLRPLAFATTTQTLSITDGKNSTENYTVWVTNYTETLKMRRSETYYYSIQLDLQEQ